MTNRTRSLSSLPYQEAPRYNISGCKHGPCTPPSPGKTVNLAETCCGFCQKKTYWVGYWDRIFSWDFPNRVPTEFSWQSFFRKLKKGSLSRQTNLHWPSTNGRERLMWRKPLGTQKQCQQQPILLSSGSDDINVHWLLLILLMEEIPNNHPGCMKLCK